MRRHPPFRGVPEGSDPAPWRPKSRSVYLVPHRGLDPPRGGLPLLWQGQLTQRVSTEGHPVTEAWSSCRTRDLPGGTLLGRPPALRSQQFFLRAVVLGLGQGAFLHEFVQFVEFVGGGDVSGGADVAVGLMFGFRLGAQLPFAHV